MKQYFYLFLFIIISSQLNAQCTGCTTTITSNSALPYSITSGQTYCVLPGVTLTGPILINGGTLCNEGTITTSRIAVTTGGTFNNFGVANIDSLLVSGTNARYVNNGVSKHVRLACTLQGSIFNHDTITCKHFGDSAAIFANQGYMHVTDTLSVGYNASATNNGTIVIGKTFMNGFSSNFTNNCTVVDTGNWYNSATIIGPTGANCGQFSVGGNAYNSGTIAATGKIDVCVTGNGAYLNNGNNGSGLTFCACTSTSCAPSAIDNGIGQLQAKIFPNPATDVLNIETTVWASYELSLFDCTGREVSSYHKEGATLQLQLNGLSAGTYLLSIKNTVAQTSGHYLVQVVR